MQRSTVSTSSATLGAEITPAQRAAALVNDASLELLRQDGVAFQDAAAILQSIISHIEGLDRRQRGAA